MTAEKKNPAKDAALALHGEEYPAVTVCLIDKDGHAHYWTQAPSWKNAGALAGCMFVAATGLASAIDQEAVG